MNKPNSTLTTKQAAALVNCNPKTIQNKINNRKLSATRDESGNFHIDMSELLRVYPNIKVPETEKNSSEYSRKGTNAEEDYSRTILELEIKHLKELLSEKTKQNEFLHAKLEETTSERSILIHTITNNQKLLEHQGSERKRKKFLGIF